MVRIRIRGDLTSEGQRMPGIGKGATVLAALVAGWGCSATPADPIDELRGELEAAAEARDAERFESRLSEDFEGPRGLTRADAVVTLRRYFAAYESVSLEIYDVEVERETASARVRFVVEFSGRARPLGGLPGLLPPAAVYRFDLGVGDEDGTWRVQTARWERLSADESR
jgi:hypothetical protein